MYRISVDRSLCNGYGVCEALAPDLFELDADGLAVVREGTTADEAAREACDACPMGAISLVRLEAA